MGNPSRSTSESLLFGSFIVLWVLLGCAKKSTDPLPERYNLYVGSNVGIVYVLDFDSLTVRDSIVLADPCFTYDIESTSDGRRIYANVLADGGRSPFTAEIEVRGLSKTYELSETAQTDLVVANLGRTLVRETCSLKLTNIDTKMSTEISGPICDIEGITDALSIAGRSATGDSLIIYNVPERRITHEFTVRTMSGEAVRTSSAVPLGDHERVAIVGLARASRIPYFLIVRLADTSTVFQHQIYGTQGCIAITEDGTRAIVPSHGEIRSGDPFGFLDIFDLDSLRHVKRFDTSSFQDSPFPADDVAFVPGSSLAVIAVGLGADGPLWELDWGASRLTRIDNTGRRWHGPVAIGPRF